LETRLIYDKELLHIPTKLGKRIDLIEIAE